MELLDQLRLLSTRVARNKDTVQTEEATKTSMVMPFIQILGYNVFDPEEVTPEFIADVGTKKGEKVDYAILREGKPDILIECKKAGADLNSGEASQLFRYFTTTSARIGVLTNGIQYRFFTDIDNPNRMDDKPFFEFNILDFRDRDVSELKKFTKSTFNIDTILEAANDLKYSKAVREKLLNLLANPTGEFVRMLALDIIAPKRFTQAYLDQFTEITKKSFDLIISEKINERLKVAMTPETTEVAIASVVVATEVVPEPDQSEIVTTPEEIAGAHIIRGLLRDIVDPERIIIRDQRSYCAISLDNSSRKTICRLRFNNLKRLQIGFLTPAGEDVRPIDNLYDIAKHIDTIRGIVKGYLGTSSDAPQPSSAP